MMDLSIVFFVLLVLPFFLGYLQLSIRGSEYSQLVYYRYFILFNMVFSGIFVAARMFLAGHQAAAISGWSYSPVFHLYGIAVLSMSLPGLLVFLRRGARIYAPAITWALFLLLSSAAYIHQLIYHELKDVDTIYLHMVYNVLAALILFRFVHRLMCRVEQDNEIMA